MATRHARLYRAFWKKPGLWTGCPHHHLHLILAISNQTEACAGPPAQWLGASNSLGAQGATGEKNLNACRKARSPFGCRVYAHIELCLPNMPEMVGWGLRAWEMIKDLLSAPKGLPLSAFQREHQRPHHFLTTHQHAPRPASGCLFI